MKYIIFKIRTELDKMNPNKKHSQNILMMAHTPTHTHTHVYIVRCIVKVTNQVSIITWSVDDLLIYSMPHTHTNKLTHFHMRAHTHTNQILLFTYLICFGDIINCRWAKGHSPPSLGHSLAFFRGLVFIFLIDRILWTTHQRRKNDRHMDKKYSGNQKNKLIENAKWTSLTKSFWIFNSIHLKFLQITSLACMTRIKMNAFHKFSMMNCHSLTHTQTNNEKKVERLLLKVDVGWRQMAKIHFNTLKINFKNRMTKKYRVHIKQIK